MQQSSPDSQECTTTSSTPSTRRLCRARPQADIAQSSPLRCCFHREACCAAVGRKAGRVRVFHAPPQREFAVAQRTYPHIHAHRAFNASSTSRAAALRRCCTRRYIHSLRHRHRIRRRLCRSAVLIHAAFYGACVMQSGARLLHVAASALLSVQYALNDARDAVDARFSRVSPPFC